MSVGARRSRDEGDDKPRDWRDAYLAPRSSTPKRKEGPEDRDRDYRGHPRHRSDRDSDYRARRGSDSFRGDESRSPGYRGKPSNHHDKFRSHSKYGSPYDKSPRQYHSPTDPTSVSTPTSTSDATRQPVSDEREDGEISPRPEIVSPPTIEKVEPPSTVSTEVQGQPPPELTLVTSPPPIEDVIAARRAKRAAILAKYDALKSQSDEVSTPKQDQDQDESIEVPKPLGEVSIQKQDDRMGSPMTNGPIDEQISAADYDPTMDRREDDARRARHVAAEALADGIGEVPSQVDITSNVDDGAGDEEVDDMFALTTDKPKKNNEPFRAPVTVPQPLALASADIASDPEGYYQIVLGEALDGGRYQVFSSLGKGMFSAVVRARIIHGENLGKEVAIKIIRAQESMYKAGLKEVQILNKLGQADPDDKKHLVRLERTFEHRGHLCLVFESLSMNLREVVKRFGKDVGLNIGAVRAYTYQLFLALSLLKKCNIMHADIKPDNILVNEQKSLLKLCDLGTASDVSENDIAPYLVSRFYRAPEIILGLPYDASLDVWSIGCTLYELYTGKILFPGRTNNQMLLHMMELKGRFNSKMIKKAKFGDVHFDENGVFKSVELDKITGKEIVKKVHITKPKRDLRARIIPSSGREVKDDELKHLLNFVDLLDRSLSLDAAKRLTPKEALNHPFVRG